MEFTPAFLPRTNVSFQDLSSLYPDQQREEMSVMEYSHQLSKRYTKDFTLCGMNNGF